MNALAKPIAVGTVVGISIVLFGWIAIAVIIVLLLAAELSTRP